MIWALVRFELSQPRAIRAAAGTTRWSVLHRGRQTLVVEYAIYDAVRRGKRCIYTAPIKALSNQKYRDFRDTAGFDVGLLTGDVTLSAQAQVLIMTTEILRNAVFESPEALADVEFAIFDEVHFLDDPERGSVWEEALIFAPAKMRFVCLSATIPNIAELGAWLAEIREHELCVIESRERPVPLHHRLFLPRRGGSARRAGQRAPTPPSASPRPRARRGRPGSRARRGRRHARDRAPADAVTHPELLPALVLRSAADCERLARRNTDRDLLSPAEHERMDALQGESRARSVWRPASTARRRLAAPRLASPRRHAADRQGTGRAHVHVRADRFSRPTSRRHHARAHGGLPRLEKFDGTSVEYCAAAIPADGRSRGTPGHRSRGFAYAVTSATCARSDRAHRGGQPEPVHSRFRLVPSLLHC